LGGIFVRGNHDKVVAGIDSVESFNPIAGVAALWNREQLNGDGMSWLETLPKGPVIMSGLSGIECVHGAPDDEDRYVVSPEEAAEQLVKAPARITFFGHTHIQGAFQLRGKFVRALHPAYESVSKQECWDLALEEESSYMINPGSIGQPRDGDWRAGFAVFDSDRRTVSFWRVPYEVRSAQEKILAAGLPARLATRLAAGR
jgi:predicted phosphodiesterase